MHKQSEPGMWRDTGLRRWIRWGELWYVTSCTLDYKPDIIYIHISRSHNRTCLNLSSATSSSKPNWLLSVQTVGGACSKRRVLSAVRMLRRASSPGRSASTSKTLATCVERPSSVPAGWSLLPTVCKMMARRGNSTLTITGHERSLVFRVMWLKWVHSCKSLSK